MFTGIIEAQGKIISVQTHDQNTHFTIQSSISQQLHIDQSLSHDGVCLTVVKVDGDRHTVTAVHETLLRTNLREWVPGQLVNLERAMQVNARLDGHWVQGHVDAKAICRHIQEEGGSWRFTFELPESTQAILVDKGSICVNGVSLTVIAPQQSQFEVAIIPYTYEHTHFRYLQVGDPVNIEFDILGKYIQAYMDRLRQTTV